MLTDARIPLPRPPEVARENTLEPLLVPHVTRPELATGYLAR
jgi:hypothetical protein